MISIIICSSSKVWFNQIKNSIKNTCGVNCEVLRIDNIDRKYSIFEAYNIGASKSKYDFLIFVHEDIIFHTNSWGLVLLDYFEKLVNPGIIGFAGSSYLPISPSDWWVSNSDYLFTNFISNNKNGRKGEGILNCKNKQIPTKVFSLDGMFLAMKKSVWEEFTFDESLKGFHGYDTSICYLVSQKYNNYFIPDILIEHFSFGYPNEIWLKNTILANQSILPFLLKQKRIEGIDVSLEVSSYRLFLRQLRKFSNSKSYQFRNAWSYLTHVFCLTMDFRVIVYFLFNCLQFLLPKVKFSNKK